MLFALARKIADAAKIAEMQLDELERMSANDIYEIAEDSAEFIMFVDAAMREVLGGPLHVRNRTQL